MTLQTMTRMTNGKMNRLCALLAIAVAGLLAGCGSSVSSSTQPGAGQVFSIKVSPAQMTLNSGDFASISATVELSVNGGPQKPVTPPPPIKFFSSDANVTVSPAGEVCAGLWDSLFQSCSKTAPPVNPVTITVRDAAHGVSNTVQVTVHLPAARITLTSDWGGLKCISQSHQALYVASAFAADANGNPTILIPSCTLFPGTAGCISDNDYVWTTDNSKVAAVDAFGSVAALNPGVTNVAATLDGTVSAPLAFVTCPPKSIVLTTATFVAGSAPAAPFTTDDLTLNIGDQKYVNATMVDMNNNPLSTSPLTYVLSDPVAASLSPVLELSSKLTANTAARFTIMAACEPPSCNPAVGEINSPAGPMTGQAAGFGYPVYSNLIGATVQGITGSAVLISGSTFSDGVTPAKELLVYDSESLQLTQTVALGHVPNSLVAAPSGDKAYLGSCDGLVMVDLTNFSVQTAFHVAGQPTTALVTGKVLGVSPNSRFVVISDNSCPSPANHGVYLLDTTDTTNTAKLFQIPNITSATFAADGSNMWIGGDAGVFVFQADTFVLTPGSQRTTLNSNPFDGTHVTSLAWMPDGQSYFASGDQLANYSTCENQNLPAPSPNLISTVPGGLNTTVIGSTIDGPITGVPHLLGLDGDQWFDYSVTTSAQVAGQSAQELSIPPLIANGKGDVCLSTVTVNLAVNPPVVITPALPCSAQQLSFSPTLEQEFITGEQEFITGVNTNPSCAPTESVIHGYDVVAQMPITFTTNNPVVPLSGGVLSDGRKLYFGSFDGNGAILHRIDLGTAPGALAEDGSVPGLDVVPNFVAVVPK